MVDHKTIEIINEWIKVEKNDKEKLEKSFDNLVVAAELLNYEMKSEYYRTSSYRADVICFVEKEDQKYKLKFILSGDLKLKKIELSITNFSSPIAIGSGDTIVEPIDRLKEML